MPIIIALVVVVAAGGYFGLSKGKGKEKPKEEAPKVGGIVDLGEFTVNLKGGTNYLRAKVAVQMDAKTDAEHMKEQLPALQDVVVSVLSDKTMNQVLSAKGKDELKVELAFEMNHRMHMLHGEAGKEEKSEEKTEGKPEKEGEKEHAEEGHEPPKERKYPDFDSDSGPVLKIYLTDFAMQ
jgi:flagellar basal body-associated protein FliL